MNIIDYLAAIMGFLILTVLPGFFLSLVIFRNDKFTLTERLYLSSAINISLVIAIALLLDFVLGVDITAENMVKSLLLVIVLSLFVWALEPHRIKKMSKIKV
jgi:uncharacterized membrane protein